LAAGAQIVSVLTAIPALFLDRPALNKPLLAIPWGAILTAVVLMLAPSRRSATARTRKPAARREPAPDAPGSLRGG
jgi:hypothetical protein